MRDIYDLAEGGVGGAAIVADTYKTDSGKCLSEVVNFDALYLFRFEKMLEKTLCDVAHDRLTAHMLKLTATTPGKHDLVATISKDESEKDLELVFAGMVSTLGTNKNISVGTPLGIEFFVSGPSNSLNVASGE